MGLSVIIPCSGLMDFSGPKKLVYFSGPKFGSTKVHKFFSLTLQKLVDLSGPKNQKFWVH